MSTLSLRALAPATQPEVDLQATLLAHKQYLIRGFSAEPVVRWRWTGSSLEPVDTPQLRTVGVFLPSGVQLKHDMLTIEGTRHTVTHSEAGYRMSSAAERVQVEVDLRGGEPATVLPELPGLVFYADLKEALTALPKQYARLLTPVVLGKKAATPVTCDCADRDTAVCEGKEASVGLVRARVLRTADPDYSDEALKKRLNAVVQIAFTVNERGAPVDLWLTHPAGSGLDENAAGAVRQYVLKPATCHSNVVPSDLFVDVRYEMR